MPEKTRTRREVMDFSRANHAAKDANTTAIADIPNHLAMDTIVFNI